jgi:formate transporter
MMMAAASGRLPIVKLLRHWAISFVGNFAGGLATAALLFYSEQYTLQDGAVGLEALRIGHDKCRIPFAPAFFLGVCCNALVCLAAWMAFSCTTVTGRILAVVFPVSGVVALGVEHCVANFYYVPIALFMQTDGPFMDYAHALGPSFPGLTWSNFLVGNLIPVTLGNMIGGAGFVALLYWLVYRRASHKAAPPDHQP